MAKILKCKKCNLYTLKKKCPQCGAETFIVKQAKFSLEDKYGEYRRVYKKKLLSGE